MRELLLKLVPENDKLIHFYIGTFLALFLGIFTSPLIVAIAILFLAFAWEIVREQLYNYKVDFMDIFFGILPSLLILATSLM